MLLLSSSNHNLCSKIKASGDFPGSLFYVRMCENRAERCQNGAKNFTGFFRPLGSEMRRTRERKERLEDEIDELFATSEELYSDTEALKETRNRLLSDNEELERQQKKLQRELDKMVESKEVMERNIHAYDEELRWQLLEPGALMSAKAYRDKKALPLLEKLKELVKNLTIKSEEEAVEDNRLLCYTGHVATPR